MAKPGIKLQRKTEMGAKQKKESKMRPQMSPSMASCNGHRKRQRHTESDGQGWTGRGALPSRGIRDPGRPSLTRHELLNFENCCGYLFLRWHLLSLSAKSEIYTQESQSQLGVVSTAWPQPRRNYRPMARRIILSIAEPHETIFSHGEH